MTAIWAVVPAGGAGTRLWPLSRRDRPKFLLDLTGAGRTLLQQTYDRLAPLVGDRFVVVTGVAHATAVAGQLDALPADRVVAEPSPRDSMAAMGLAAAILERRDPEAVMGAFPADHVVGDPETFRDRVARAAALAEDGWLVTIGIEPTHPATGFGYIRLGDPVPGGYAVAEFVEKPDAERAAAYLREGGFRWNAGMFVVRPRVLLDLLAEQDAAFAATLRTIAAEPGRLAELWPTLPRISIDYAVAEPAAARGRVAVVPGSFGWDDVGDFASLTDLAPDGGEGGLRVVGDRALVRGTDATGLVVPHDRLLAVVGLDDVVVVDTGDALLVTTRERAQDVKAVVAELAGSRPDLT